MVLATPGPGKRRARHWECAVPEGRGARSGAERAPRGSGAAAPARRARLRGARPPPLPAAPRPRSQGRGGRHHLVSRLPGHKGRARKPPNPGPSRAPPAPTHLQAQGSTAAPQELADVAQALALRPRLRVHLQEKRRRLSAGRRRHRTGAERSGVLHPAAALTSRSLRRQRRRSLPPEALNREVNTEHRKWRARAGGGGQERGQGCPGQARSRAALPRRGGHREGRTEGGTNGRRGGTDGGREGRTEGGAALPSPAPAAGRSARGSGPGPRRTVLPNFSKCWFTEPSAVTGLAAGRSGPGTAPPRAEQ